MLKIENITKACDVLERTSTNPSPPPQLWIIQLNFEQTLAVTLTAKDELLSQVSRI